MGGDGRPLVWFADRKELKKQRIVLYNKTANNRSSSGVWSGLALQE